MRPRRWERHLQRGRYRGSPAFVRSFGCVVSLLLILTAVSSSTLVSVSGGRLLRGVALAIALAMIVVITAVFVLVLRRVTYVFREQDRLRRQLMADVAHELRTPLSILQGRIEGLLDGVYPRDDAHIGELLAETQHLSRLVEDVRTVANAEAGALDLRKECIDLAELIRDTARSFPRPIRVDVPPSLELDADPVRIREVLLNLLSNALEHAPEGNVSIAATTQGREIVIRVSDDGPGIPAEELPRLFERFHKGARSRGSGLGLSIAQKLVVAHGGTIAVESREGVGTTVIVKL